MTKKNYSSFVELAQRLIDKFGTEWIYRFVNKGVYDPANNTRTIDSTDDTVVQAVRLDYEKKQIDGEVVKRGDFRLIVETKDGFTPNTEGKMLYDGKEWQIVEILEQRPADTVIYYEMQMR